MKQLIGASHIFITILIGAGCANLPPIAFHLDDVSPAKTKTPLELRSIVIRLAAASKRTGKIQSVFLESRQDAFSAQFSTGNTSGSQTYILWRDALSDAIDRKVIFTDNASRTVSLNVEILRLELTGLSNATVTTEARYMLIDRSNGSALWEKTVVSNGVATPGEAFVGALRARLAFNRSVRHNISNFIEMFEKDITAGRVK